MPFDESPLEETVTNGYSPEMQVLELVSYLGVWDLDNSPSPNSTFVGKLRLYIPSLYCSLTGWERDHLDSFYSVETFVTGVTDKIEALVSEPKVLAPNSETISTTPVTCLDEWRPHSSFQDTHVSTTSVLTESLMMEGSPLSPSYGEPTTSKHSLDRL